MRMTQKEFKKFISEIEIVPEKTIVHWEYFGKRFIKNKDFYSYKCPNCKIIIETTSNPENFIKVSSGRTFCGYCGNKNIERN